MILTLDAEKPAVLALLRDLESLDLVRVGTPGEAPESAEAVWAWNRAHPEELHAGILKLRGSLSSSAFGGMDGVTYQRSVRDEWKDDRENHAAYH